MMGSTEGRPLIDRYVVAARAAGDALLLTELAAAGHFAMLAPAHPAFAALAGAVAAIADGDAEAPR
jgi:hypothetical protein